MLATVFLAIYYAPLPNTSVESADEILSSIEGSWIRVSGFITSLSILELPENLTDMPQTITFALADFSDYQRYVADAADGSLTDSWWTIRPIDVKVIAGGYRVGGGPYLSNLGNGTNVSVLAKVVSSVIGPNSAITGLSLYTSTSEDFKVGAAPGEFNLLTAPIAQKIFYFHMPSAWICYLAFFITLLSSAMYLKTKSSKYDLLASCSAELGVLFATIAIATGPIWAKQEWGVYWRWDDTKLVTTFVLWLVYIGYLSLRAAVPEHGTRARVSAVYGILGFVTVPMSLLSSRIAPLLRSSHPKVIASSSGGLSPEAGITIIVAVTAFTLLFAAMLIKRFEVAESEEELEELKRVIGGEE